MGECRLKPRPRPEGRESAAGLSSRQSATEGIRAIYRSAGGASALDPAARTGCANAMASACSACRGQASSAAAIGAGTDAEGVSALRRRRGPRRWDGRALARCTRSWCVRPVSGASRRNVAPRKRSRTSKRVTAGGRDVLARSCACAPGDGVRWPGRRRPCRRARRRARPRRSASRACGRGTGVRAPRAPAACARPAAHPRCRDRADARCRAARDRRRRRERPEAMQERVHHRPAPRARAPDARPCPAACRSRADERPRTAPPAAGPLPRRPRAPAVAP